MTDGRNPRKPPPAWMAPPAVARVRVQPSSASQAASSMTRPGWFRRSAIPFELVCGPLGGGKSTSVRENADAGARLAATRPRRPMRPSAPNVLLHASC